MATVEGITFLQECDRQQEDAHNEFPLASSLVVRTLVLARAFWVLL